MGQEATATGDDLQRALRSAVQDLIDSDDVELRLTLPDDIEVESISVALTAEVSRREEDVEDSDDSEDSDDVDDSEGTSAPDSDDSEDSVEDDEADDSPTLDEEADAAADFVEGILDTLDLPGQLKIRILDEEDMAEVEVVEVGSGALIGRRGQTLEAVQELLRSALQREFQQRSRVKIDVEGYRARRLEKLLDKAEDAIDDVLDTGDAQRLEPMDVFERKAVHRLVASYDGVASRSQGREPGRRVVIEPA